MKRFGGLNYLSTDSESLGACPFLVRQRLMIQNQCPLIHDMKSDDVAKNVDGKPVAHLAYQKPTLEY